ncbi:hypothetical protein C8J56DRAFT_1038065 [Mycena floridula]|nr:hypothetical protein C8J56DRAFT_1038065 [Mycena floridula]
MSEPEMPDVSSTAHNVGVAGEDGSGPQVTLTAEVSSTQVVVGPRKRGNKGNFSGEKLAFLEKWSDEFRAATKKGPFWHKFFEAWGQTFNSPPTILDVTTVEGEEPLGEELEAARKAAKVKREAETKLEKERLKCWFANNQSKVNRT